MSPPTCRPGRGRVRALAAVATATVTIASAVGLSTAAATFSSPRPDATSSAPNASRMPQCPVGDQCASIPARCPKSQVCPMVIARPATGLGSDQWLYLSLKGFPAGTDAEIYYCSDKKRITTAAHPPCVLSTSSTLPYPEIQTPIFPNGTAVSSFHVQSDLPGSGNPAFAGQVPGNPRATLHFFCDDTTDPCSIDVVDPALVSPPSNVPGPSNTSVVPVRFLPSTDGCPAAARNNWIVYTSSDWGIYNLLPHESPSACEGSHPVIALDTATDSHNALTQLVSGADQVAFVEDPDATDLRTVLAHSGRHYAFIPIVAWPSSWPTRRRCNTSRSRCSPSISTA